MRQLIQYAHLGQREWAVEVSFAEQPDLPCIKTIEAADHVHPIRVSVHIASVNDLLDGSQLSRESRCRDPDPASIRPELCSLTGPLPSSGASGISPRRPPSSTLVCDC